MKPNSSLSYMEREYKKRARQEEEVKEESERTAKKQEVERLDDYDHFKLSSDSRRPLGVFDFPWMEENNPVCELDEWKIDDVFSSSLLDTSFSGGIYFSGEELFCETQVLLEFPQEKFDSKEVWPSEEDQNDGLDCIWSSVLNQPLSTGGSSKIANL